MDEGRLCEELDRCNANLKERQCLKEKYEQKLYLEEDPRKKSFYEKAIEEMEEEIKSYELKYQQLAKRLNELDKQNTISIPYVIAAMTREEASKLIDGSILNDPKVSEEKRDQFKRFKEELKLHGIDDFVPYYGLRRENWIPYLDQQKSIKEIIEEISEHINEKCKPQDLPMIQPYSLSMDFFDDNQNKRLETWKILNQSGGVLIVDALSLYHPLIRRYISKSEISSKDSVAMLVLSPVSPKNNYMNKLISDVIMDEMEYAYHRHYKMYDLLCCIGVGDAMDLKRNLSAVLQKEADLIHNPKANPANINKLRKKQGAPRGITRYISGPLGE